MVRMVRAGRRLGWWATKKAIGFYAFVAFSVIHWPLFSVAPEAVVQPLIEAVGFKLEEKDDLIRMMKESKGGSWTNEGWEVWPKGSFDPYDDIHPLDWGRLFRYL